MMLWDKLFWLWFALSAVLVAAFYLSDAPGLSIAFGALAAGLGLTKLSQESAHRRSEARKPEEIRVSRKLLKGLERK
jgi:Kef-type K+ transport system membrane component KefB